MSNKIISLSDKTNLGTMRSPLDALNDAIKCVGKEGALEKGKKVLIIALDESGEGYSVNWFQAGMKMSECIALCEVAKTLFLTEMEYIPNE